MTRDINCQRCPASPHRLRQPKRPPSFVFLTQSHEEYVKASRVGSRTVAKVDSIGLVVPESGQLADTNRCSGPVGWVRQ